jgi:hypothetical protein
MGKLPTEVERQSEAARARYRHSPSALVSDGDVRQKKTDSPPAPSRPNPSAVARDAAVGDMPGSYRSLRGKY